MADRRRALVLLAAITVTACTPARTADPVASAPATLDPAPAGPAATSPSAPATAARATTATPATSTTTTVPATTTTLAATTTAAPTSPTTIATTLAPTTTIAAPTTTGVPAVEARAYAVYDMRSGTMLASADADARLAVGSLMKLLTAYVAYAAGDPAKVVVAPSGLLQSDDESAIGIRVGQPLPRDLLIRAMLVVSANDAARALAIDIAGDEATFAGLMNGAALGLGLANTNAVNATGLDAEGQHSSAADMVTLSLALLQNPTFQITVRRTEAMLNDQRLPATNDLLGRYPGADGIKTGRTSEAGWCIVASANRDGRRIIAVVLGAPTEQARTEAATALLDWGFSRP